MFPKDGGQGYTAKANTDGLYKFHHVEKPGLYQINVLSTRCIGLTDRDDERVVRLDPAKTAIRDFILKLACQVRILVVDEQGQPIRNVWFYKPGPFDGNVPKTDKTGHVTIGGLSPSAYRFAARHDDYAIASLDVQLADPKTVVKRKLTLTKGVAVRGVVICSDGKPASGCAIRALPSWWNSTLSPHGRLIDEKGSFEYPHVGPGTYKISVSVPQGNGMSIVPVVMNDVDLLHHKQPFTINVNFPSPAAMGFIEGRVRFLGSGPRRGFWIHANPNGTFFGASRYLKPGEETFKLGPMPAGRYNVNVNSEEYEPKELRSIAAGTKDLVVDLQHLNTLRGVITGAEKGQALKSVRLAALRERGHQSRSSRDDSVGGDRHPAEGGAGRFADAESDSSGLPRKLCPADAHCAQLSSREFSEDRLN